MWTDRLAPTFLENNRGQLGTTHPKTNLWRIPGLEGSCPQTAALDRVSGLLHVKALFFRGLSNQIDFVREIQRTLLSTTTANA